MANREISRCQRRKSFAESPADFERNGEATEKEGMRPELTTYVNTCNLSTPDIVENSGNVTYILF